MRNLTREETEYAVGRLVRLIEAREIKQEALERDSDVSQSTISKIKNGWKEQGAEKYLPSAEILTKLFGALGHKLGDILSESDSVGEEIFGYLATPLTGLSAAEDRSLRATIQKIKEIAADPLFSVPPFELYWPGDHTHPVKNPDILAKQVYITDRTRAATHDFIIMVCAVPSYGVGQENEIATQAGVPVVRLVPAAPRLSRMMLGSFALAADIEFTGSLEQGIRFDEDKLRAALDEVRREYFRTRAMYRGLNGEDFGERLRALIDSRGHGYAQFAQDLGISTSYLHSLMDESFAVSNPSIRLLKRIAHRLNERVSYLIGESEEADPIWIDSHGSWRAWIRENPEVGAAAALAIREDWDREYAILRRDHSTFSVASHRRSSPKRMETKDWDFRYQKLSKAGNGNGKKAQSASLF